jgi:hypothetical protein
MTNDRWLAFVLEGAIRTPSSPTVRFGEHHFVCVGSGSTREKALEDSVPYAGVRLYENVSRSWMPKAEAGNDGAGWFELQH